jgi:transposase
MNKFTTIAGIDLGKSSLSVCVFHADRKPTHHVFTNNASGLGQFFKLLAELQPQLQNILLCCENTGRYMSNLAYVCSGSGVTLWAVHPLIMANYDPDFQRAKTDKTDAVKIMEYAFAHQHKAIDYHLPDRVSLELKELFLLRKQLVGHRQQSKNQLSAYKDSAIPSHYSIAVQKQLIGFLNDLIRETEKVIKALIKADESFNRKYHILISIPGIGEVIAQHLLFKTECFKSFKSWKSLACYIGSAPFEKQSGSSLKRTPKTSKKAYRKLKADLNQGVMSITRKGQLFHEYYTTMISRKVPHLVIINNLINVQLRTVFNLISKDVPFDKNIFLANKKSWKDILVMS